MTTRIKFRRDTAVNWATENPVLALGEPGLETNTRKVKYGDGVTAWNSLSYAAGGTGNEDLAVQFGDGVNTNTWRIVTVQGSKSFDYKTPGHEYIVIQNTQNLEDSSTYVVDLAEYDTTMLDLAVTNNSNIYYYVNNDYNNRVGVSVSKDGTTYTFTSNGATIYIASGDEMTIEYWVRGTQYQYDKWSDQNGLLANNTSTSTNTLVFDNTYWENSDIADYFTSNVTQHIITFNGVTEDIRTVSNVVQDGNVFTITFDGDPRAVTAPSVKTIETTPTDTGDGSNYMHISREQNPDLANVMNTYQNYVIQESLIPGVSNGWSLTVTIDGGEPIRGYLTGSDSRDNYEIYLENSASWYSTTPVVINYEDKGTEFDLDLYIEDQNWTGLNDGYRWFDWRTDLGETYVNAPGNGVQGGRFMVHYKVYNFEDKQVDHNTLVMNWNNNEYEPYTEPQDVDGNSPYNYGNDGNGENYVMNDFDDNGIAFASWWGGYGDSKNLKVRIMYKFELVIGEDNLRSGDWFDC